MKASKEWLNEFVDIDSESLEHLEERLTITGTKVETIDTKAETIKNVVVGKILKIKKHPNADKLVVTEITTKDEKYQIVTGADNISEGDIIPVALPGAILPGNFQIKSGKLRGVESNGMLCSSVELELPDNFEGAFVEEGIMILPKKYEKNLGENIIDVLKLDNPVFDFEITPNRPDCLGILGIARELSVALNKEFKGYEILTNKKEVKKQGINFVDKLDDLEVKIEDEDCNAYCAIVIDNVKIQKSPLHIQDRLNAVGIQPINNVVDLSNYIMYELGQPMHTFDKNLVKENIIIRKAKKGEKLTLLDGKEYVLDEELVIANKDEAVGVAGVMGGKDSGISEETTTVVVEIANFDGPRTRRASKSLSIRSESSGRFEKTLPISYIYTAIMRTKELVKELNIGDMRKDVIYVGKKEDKKVEIEFDSEYINKMLGINIPKNDMLDILERLGFDTKSMKDKVIVPTYRQDVNIKADLIEEVIRFYGFDKLESTLPEVTESERSINKYQELEKKVRAFLVSNGLNEICTYGFVNDKTMDKLELNEKDIRLTNQIYLENPLSSDYTTMRTTMIPSILNTVKINLDMKTDNLHLFDISRTYIAKKQEIKETENNKENKKNKNEKQEHNNENLNKLQDKLLPIEEKYLSIATTGDFFELKQIVYNMMENINAGSFRIDRSEDKIYHPGKSAKMFFGRDIIGNFGEINPKILTNFGINKTINVAEINLTKILSYMKENIKYKEISKYPAVERDLAIVVNENITYEEIERIVTRASKKYLEKMTLFDIYRSKEKLGEDKKSIAFALKFRSMNSTLDDETINNVIDNIVTNLKKSIKAEWRK